MNLIYLIFRKFPGHFPITHRGSLLNRIKFENVVPPRRTRAAVSAVI